MDMVSIVEMKEFFFFFSTGTQSNGSDLHVSLESSIHVIELISIFDTYHLFISSESEVIILFSD